MSLENHKILDLQKEEEKRTVDIFLALSRDALQMGRFHRPYDMAFYTEQEARDYTKKICQLHGVRLKVCRIDCVKPASG